MRWSTVLSALALLAVFVIAEGCDSRPPPKRRKRKKKPAPTAQKPVEEAPTPPPPPPPPPKPEPPPAPTESATGFEYGAHIRVKHLVPELDPGKKEKYDAMIRNRDTNNLLQDPGERLAGDGHGLPGEEAPEDIDALPDNG